MTKKTFTISIAKANIFSALISIPIAVVYITPFIFFHPLTNLALGIDQMLKWLILVFPIGIILHELLHGFIWAIFAQKGFSSIRFGIKWKVLTPYCHCKEPLLKWQYLLGTIMPFIVLGFVPAIWAWFTGNAFVLLFGVFFSWASGGDLLGVWLLRRLTSDQCVSDHPHLLGFTVVDCPKH